MSRLRSMMPFVTSLDWQVDGLAHLSILDHKAGPDKDMACRAKMVPYLGLKGVLQMEETGAQSLVFSFLKSQDNTRLYSILPPAKCQETQV